MTIDEQGLRRAAEAANPSPWVVISMGSSTEAYGHAPGSSASCINEDESASLVVKNLRFGDQAVKDAEFIAAANPQVVLALLDELAEARAFKETYHEQWMLNARELERLEAKIQPCARCGKREVVNPHPGRALIVCQDCAFDEGRTYDVG